MQEGGKPADGFTSVRWYNEGAPASLVEFDLSRIGRCKR